VRALNRRYRGVNRATDVLSFPVEGVGRPLHTAKKAGCPELVEGQGRRGAGLKGPRYISSPEPRATSRCLGDIVIARGVARRQAREAGHSELTEWRVLALHGLLHLLGYDHERDRGRMRRVERRLRRQGGLPDGLIERAGRT